MLVYSVYKAFCVQVHGTLDHNLTPTSSRSVIDAMKQEVIWMTVITTINFGQHLYQDIYL